MIQINKIIDASSTVQALDAQKNNLEEKKTIIDSIEEDFSSTNQSSSNNNSMFNFGKNLHKKKRHNSDVVGSLSNANS